MTDLVTILRAIVRDELKSLRLGDIAVVSRSYPHADGDASNHQCDVTLRESGLVVEKVPIATPHVGMVSAPQKGDLVFLSYVGGDANRPVILGRFYSEKASPPPHADGELHIVSKPNGEASIVIDKEDSIIVAAGETIIKLEKGKTVTIQGPKDLVIQVDGDVALKCVGCKIDASGDIELGAGGGGVITTASHRCYFTGAALVGSNTVKAKG